MIYTLRIGPKGACLFGGGREDQQFLKQTEKGI